jgi:hypothetical protein
VTVGIALLWIISVRTASSYEARTPQSAGAKEPTAGGGDCALAGSQFWRGKELVDRQRTLHTVAALATVALVASVAGPSDWVHAVLSWLAALLIAATVLIAATPAADRDAVAERARQADTETTRADAGATWLIAQRPRRMVMIAAAAAVVVIVGVVDAADGTWDSAMTGTLAVSWRFLTIAQIVLLCVLWLAVLQLARRSGAPKDSHHDARWMPYLRGNGASAITTLAVVVGGLLSAVVEIGVARLCGNPVPSDAIRADATLAVAVPAPVYAYAAAPVGFGLAALVVGFWLSRRFARNRRTHLEEVASEYGAQPPQAETAPRNRLRIAAAWAVGDLADDAGPVLGVLAVGGVAAAAAAAFAPFVLGPLGEVFVQGLLTAGTLVTLLIAGWLVATLRRAYSDGNQRRVIGAIWDVGTFWPRATHPFAPPCYAERAIPEVVDRIGVLAGIDAVDLGLPADPAVPPALSLSTGPVLLTGYSQGAIIAPAVIAQLKSEVRGRVALLTLACPARRLYGRAFPAYFGPDQIQGLVTLLSDADGVRRWTNLARRSDYIGSWVEAPPAADPMTGTTLDLDRRCLDPVALVPDANPTPPPVHRHSAWWPDPRVAEVAVELVRLLTGRELPQAPCAADAERPRPARPLDEPAAATPKFLQSRPPTPGTAPARRPGTPRA